MNIEEFMKIVSENLEIISDEKLKKELIISIRKDLQKYFEQHEDNEWEQIFEDWED